LLLFLLKFEFKNINLLTKDLNMLIIKNIKKEVKMKIMIVIIGILIILAGILPFLSNFNVLPASVLQKPGYQFIIIAIGIIGLLYGFMNSMLFGTEKFVTISIGLLTILGGILPFIQNYVPAIIPTTGPLYSGLIIVIGVIGIIYGFIALG